MTTLRRLQLKQPAAQLLLQFADVVADGRLADSVAAGRLGEVQGLGHGNKVFELTNIHRKHLICPIMPENSAAVKEALDRLILFYYYIIQFFYYTALFYQSFKKAAAAA